MSGGVSYSPGCHIFIELCLSIKKFTYILPEVALGNQNLIYMVMRVSLSNKYLYLFLISNLGIWFMAVIYFEIKHISHTHTLDLLCES